MLKINNWQTDGQSDGQINEWKDKKTNGQSDRKTYSQFSRETNLRILPHMKNKHTLKIIEKHLEQ